VQTSRVDNGIQVDFTNLSIERKMHISYYLQLANPGRKVSYFSIM